VKPASTSRSVLFGAILVASAFANAQTPKSQLISSFETEYKKSPVVAERIFWQSLKTTPVVEPITDNPNSLLVTFVYRGSADTGAILFYSPLPTFDSPPFFSQVEKSSVWYRSFVLPSDSRFTYAIEELKGKVPHDIEGRMKLKREGSQPDPLNLNPGGSSLVELPDALPYGWCTPLPGLPRASQIGSILHSQVFEEDRPVNISLPYGYEKDKDHNLLVLFDHDAYAVGDKSAIPASLIIDNLMYDKRIGSTVIVTIANISDTRRMTDLTCNEKMVKFVAEELIPWIQKEYRAGLKPERTVISGSSLGGLQATFCGLKRPDVFGGVLSQGGSFWYFPEFREGPAISTEYGWLNRQVYQYQLSKTHFYLQADLFEQDIVGNPLMMTRNLRDILRARGFAVSYQDLAGGHEYSNWKASFGEAIRQLLWNR